MATASMAKMELFESPRKIYNSQNNQTYFFYSLRNFYALIMKMLGHSWFEIMDFSQNQKYFYFLALRNVQEMKVVK